MEHSATTDAAIAVSLALAAGMIAQSLARHLRLPGIVLLLGTGHLLGPDLLGWVRPESLGDALPILVGFAVAVILFEGGLNLQLSRLRHQARVIRRLITVGALITAAGAALAAWVLMGWDWRLAVGFGSLVVVTGPTVITPLLRRIKVKRKVETLLEAEGVLVDAVGAVLAVVTLEVVLSASAASVAEGLLDVLTRLGFGVIAGLTAGFVIGFALRVKRLIPEGLENVFTLALVLAFFQSSNTVLPESGIVTVTVAGMVVGNSKTRVRRELMEFKEQLTVMFIGMLFVLLAADVRVEQALALGLPGVLTVACLMFLVRPLNIAASTIGSDLSWKERLFLSWLAPRGVVAAAVASLFAQTLGQAGIEGGEELRALVFTVIAGTVLVQGLSGGLVASLLDLRRPRDRGWVILGANRVGLALGRLLAAAAEEIVFIDSNHDSCRAAEEEGFGVVYGNAIEERTLHRAQIEDRRGCIAVTPSPEVNLLFAAAAAEEFKIQRIYVALRHGSGSVTPDIVASRGAEVLFGGALDLELWIVRFRRKLVSVEPWVLEVERADPGEQGKRQGIDSPQALLLPLVLRRGGATWPVGAGRRPRRGDVVFFGLFQERIEQARAWLAEEGWKGAEPEVGPDPDRAA